MLGKEFLEAAFAFQTEDLLWGKGCCFDCELFKVENDGPAEILGFPNLINMMMWGLQLPEFTQAIETSVPIEDNICS